MATLKQSTAYTRVFKMISSTDHFSLKAAAAPVVNLSKAGAAFGVAAGAITEIASGWYKIALTSADTSTLGDLAFYITGTGADDTDFCDQVTAQILGDTLNANVVSFTAGAITTAAFTAGAINSTVAPNLDAAVSSRMATYTQPTGFLAATFPAGTLASTTNITAGIITTTTNLTNLPSIPANWLTATGTDATFGPKVATAIWQDAVGADFTTASSIGKSLYTAGVVPGANGGLFIAGTNAATTITGSLTTTFTGNLTGSVGSVTGAVGSVTGAVGSVTGNVGGNVNGNVVGSVGSVTAGVTVTTNNDKTGYGLSAAAVQAVWDALTSALTTANSIGKLLVDNINATITSRMATYAQPAGFLAATFPAGTIANQTNITGGTITTVTNLTNAPTVGDLTAVMQASVKTQVVNTLTVDTYAQPGQATPAATTTIQTMLSYLYKAWRNRTTQTASQLSLYNDDATTVDQKTTFSDDGTTADRGEITTGP